MRDTKYVRLHHSLFFAIIIGLVSSSVNAAIFVNIPGIPGESADANHGDWIDALGASGNFTANSCGEFFVKKELDVAFPLLVASAASGRAFSEIVVETTAIFSGSRATVSVITLDGAVITSISTDMSGDETGHVEIITIEASSITILYNHYDSEGNFQGAVTETVICGKSKDK
jgi:type VI protein secretion system component Hcp